MLGGERHFGGGGVGSQGGLFRTSSPAPIGTTLRDRAQSEVHHNSRFKRAFSSKSSSNDSLVGDHHKNLKHHDHNHNLHHHQNVPHHHSPGSSNSADFVVDMKNLSHADFMVADHKGSDGLSTGGSVPHMNLHGIGVSGGHHHGYGNSHHGHQNHGHGNKHSHHHSHSSPSGGENNRSSTSAATTGPTTSFQPPPRNAEGRHEASPPKPDSNIKTQNKKETNNLLGTRNRSQRRNSESVSNKKTNVVTSKKTNIHLRSSVKSVESSKTTMTEDEEEDEEESDSPEDNDSKYMQENRSCFLLTDAQLTSLKPCSERVLAGAKILNEAIRKQSSKAAMVITNLPDIPANESAFAYMQFVETLTAEMERVLLVRGTSAEVISVFT